MIKITLNCIRNMDDDDTCKDRCKVMYTGCRGGNIPFVFQHKCNAALEVQFYHRAMYRNWPKRACCGSTLRHQLPGGHGLDDDSKHIVFAAFRFPYKRDLDKPNQNNMLSSICLFWGKVAPA